jgi:hypothetical protein
VSEIAKFPDDPGGPLTLLNERHTPDNQPAANASPQQDVEAQMRRALGLFGAPRRQDADQAAAIKPPPPADRFGAGGHRRRFAQDGEVLVTVLNRRRDHPAETPVNRLGVAETAAVAERAAREKAERALAEAQATIHDLQTKLGHASLAKTELHTAAQRDQEAIAAVRAELRETNERLGGTEAAREQIQQRLSAIEEDYAEERNARLQAERVRRDAEAARADAERRLRTLDLIAGEPAYLPVHQPARSRKAGGAAKSNPRAPTRRSKVGPAVAEPEPVQWWLMNPKTTKRR